MTTLDEIKAAAARLSDAERGELFEFLCDRATDQDDEIEEYSPEYQAELDRRIADIDAGTAQAIPGDDFLNELWGRPR